VRISGDYQYRAATEGNAIQRFWHLTKRLSIERFLPPDPSDKVIDVGCGSGVISAFLAERCADVVGIDGNDAAIEFARRRFQAPNLRFERGLVDEDFGIREPVDKIYCLEVIEHIYLEQTRKMLEAFLSVLVDGGRVFVTTPNYKSLWPVIEWLMDRFGLAPRMEGHQHVERYSPGRLRRVCEATGFTVETVATTCFAAPWLAPLSWSLAVRVNSLETGWPFVPGCVIICVLRKGVA
jgi:2-polyprenyl-3-methyl-5-hydroxy-6-metoxy-1,4-benzoquinol methylase